MFIAAFIHNSQKLEVSTGGWVAKQNVEYT